MTPLARLLRNAWERAFGTFEEGPAPPARLAQLVVEFANMYPGAKRSDWTLFAKRAVDQAYRAGYVRGFEQSVRDPNVGWRKYPPELMADLQDPDWRWRPVHGDELALPDEVVEDDVPAVDLAGHAHNPPDQ